MAYPYQADERYHGGWYLGRSAHQRGQAASRSTGSSRMGGRMNPVLFGEELDSWAEVMEAVAAALADHPLTAGKVLSQPDSLLAAVAGNTPPMLHEWQRHRAGDPTAGEGEADWRIYQNDLPVRLLASGIIQAAVGAVTACRGCPLAGPPVSSRGPDARVVAVVAVCALSTLGLEVTGEDALVAQVRDRIPQFSTSGWVEALGSLSARTQELYTLLRAARDRRSQPWPHVTVDDRILTEAAAAAVVGGAAAASGIPPEQWLFAFHLFCRLAVSAAESALSTIEQWLGVGFQPAPHTTERRASLAALAAGQAASLWQGCACKAVTEPGDLGFEPRGSCRQPDHDLRSWQPGQPKPGSRKGSRYASTLWGWLRRSLGGGGRPGGATEAGRPRLQTNDVAGSVLARQWLSTDRGFGGPGLVYDRILPEYCLRCERKVQLVSRPTSRGHIQVERACCPDPERVYRSDFAERDGKLQLRPKLGLVVVWPDAPRGGALGETTGHAGYRSTHELGSLWLCRTSGRYSLARLYCPACGPASERDHQQVSHGYVLLPLGDAWQDLLETAQPADTGTQPAVWHTVSVEELRSLEQVVAAVQPGTRPVFTTAADVWTVAKNWSKADIERFRNLAGQSVLELFLRCKQIAAAGSQDQAPIHHGSTRSQGMPEGPGGEFVD